MGTSKKLVSTNLSWNEAENLWDSRTKETNAIHEIHLVGATGKWSVYQRLTNGQPTILSVKF